jgi:hypothetical protein
MMLQRYHYTFAELGMEPPLPLGSRITRETGAAETGTQDECDYYRRQARQEAS